MTNMVEGKKDIDKLNTEKHRYGSMKFTDYIQEIKADSTITESSAERLYNIVSKDSFKKEDVREYPFFRKGRHSIRGLTDVINQEVLGIYAVAQFSKNGQMPLIIHVGPTGSGKTEMGKLFEDGLVNYLEENPRYTFYFVDDGKELPCPINEDPINLLATSRSLIPDNIRKEFIEKGGKNLCRTCSNNYNRLLQKEYSKFEENQEQKSKGSGVEIDSEIMEEEGQSVIYALNNVVKITRLKPQMASIQLTHKEFPNIFERVIKEANRGILNIEIDDTKMDDIPKTNYQLLLKLRDVSLPLKDGSLMTPDFVVFLYSNRDLREFLEGGDNNPLVDRLYPVFVRRNLSYSAESEIFRKNDLPFEHISPGATEVLSAFAVGTRINVKNSHKEFDEDDFNNLLDIYEKYDTGLSLNDVEKEVVKKRLPPHLQTIDGWNTGKSSGRIGRELFSTLDNQYACLTLEKIINYLNPAFLTHKDSVNSDEDFENTKYSYSLNTALKLATNIAFARLSVGYLATAYEIDGGIKKIEELFSYYKSLLDKKIEFETEIDVIGIGKVSIDKELENISKKLNAYDTSFENFNGAIETYKVEKGRFPDFLELVTFRPDIINLDDNMKKYLPWERITDRGEINKEDKEKYEKLKNVLKDSLGHCDECADSIIFVGAGGIY